MNYCCRIDGTHSGPDPYIDVNIEQGVLDQYGYPLERRHLIETTVTSGFELTAFNPYAGQPTAGVEAGQRAICIDETTSSAVEKFTAGRPVAAPRDGAGDGYWLRFSKPDGEPLPDSYQISRVDLAGDVDSPCGEERALVVILDVRGFRESHAPGSTAFIDYGWKPGETFFAMAPPTTSAIWPCAMRATTCRPASGAARATAVCRASTTWRRESARSFAPIPWTGASSAANSEVPVKRA